MAERLIGEAAWPALVNRLQALDAAGVDGHAALADAFTGRDLSDAVDAAAVVDWRLRQHQPDVGLGDQRTTSPGLAHRTTFLEATPEPAGPVDAEPLLHYARQLAERMDQRVEALQERMVNDPPRWADPLGPLPEDPANRLEWTERSGIVAAYQEIVAGDPDDPLGARPGPGQPDIRARWDTATEAL